MLPERAHDDATFAVLVRALAPFCDGEVRSGE